MNPYIWKRKVFQELGPTERGKTQHKFRKNVG